MTKLDETKKEDLRQFAKAKEGEAGEALDLTELLTKREDLTGKQLAEALDVNAGAASRARSIAARVRRFVGGGDNT